MIKGLHHITLVCADAQRTIDFYARVLGLRTIKLTVNFDVPDTYHLYFGDETGSPGTAITFFEWPTAPRGFPGIGGTHHFALGVDDRDGLLRWKRRLVDQGVRVTGPLDRYYFTSLYFRDPDGAIVEIATKGPGFTLDEPADALGTTLQTPPADVLARNSDVATVSAETWPEPVPEIDSAMALRYGMHHISALCSDIERTHAFYNGLLEIPLIKRTANFDDPDMPHWYWGLDGGQPGTVITYFEMDALQSRRAQVGTGQTHHFALAVPDEDSQAEWREKLIRAGFQVTPIIDRTYFKSIYTSDPDGHIVELATLGPGFLVDESVEELGQQLKLPPWLEKQRAEIEAGLKPVDVPEWHAPETV